MEIALGILLGLVALICFSGGINIMRKGSASFLPKATRPQPVLDNLVRFLSGIYLGSGFLFAYAAFNISDIGQVSYFLGIIVASSGLGRLYSRIKVGTAGNYFDRIMVVEILLGLTIILLTAGCWLQVG